MMGASGREPKLYMMQLARMSTLVTAIKTVLSAMSDEALTAEHVAVRDEVSFLEAYDGVPAAALMLLGLYQHEAARRSLRSFKADGGSR